MVKNKSNKGKKSGKRKAKSSLNKYEVNGVTHNGGVTVGHVTRGKVIVRFDAPNIEKPKGIDLNIPEGVRIFNGGGIMTRDTRLPLDVKVMTYDAFDKALVLIVYALFTKRVDTVMTLEQWMVTELDATEAGIEYVLGNMPKDES